MSFYFYDKLKIGSCDNRMDLHRPGMPDIRRYTPLPTTESFVGIRTPDRRTDQWIMKEYRLWSPEGLHHLVSPGPGPVYLYQVFLSTDTFAGEYLCPLALAIEFTY